MQFFVEMEKIPKFDYSNFKITYYVYVPTYKSDLSDNLTRRPNINFSTCIMHTFRMYCWFFKFGYSKKNQFIIIVLFICFSQKVIFQIFFIDRYAQFATYLYICSKWIFGELCYKNWILIFFLIFFSKKQMKCTKYIIIL